MRSSLVLLSSLLLSIAACSSNASSSGSPTAADEQKAVDDIVNQPAGETVCSTLDYAHASTVDNYFRFFDSDAKAGEYMTKLLATGQLAANSGPDAKLKEITQDARLLRLVSEVFDGFKKAFPRETAGLTTPPKVAVVESEIVNAFALGTGFAEEAGAPKDRSPYLFIVHTAILNRNAADNELRGLFAHELGHLLLRTFLPEIQQRVRSIYMVGKAGEDGVLGAVQEDNVKASEHVEKILKLQVRESGLADLGLPVLLDAGQYMKIINLVMKQVPASDAQATAACAAATTKIDALKASQSTFLKNSAIGDLVPSARTPQQQAQLDNFSKLVVADLKACLAPANEKGSLMQLVAQVNSLPAEAAEPTHPDHAKLLDLMVDIEMDVDAEMPDAKIFDRLFVAEERMRAELVKLRQDPAFPIEKIRVFDYEEDADDASARVLAMIGDDPAGVGKFLISTVPDDAKAKCIADVAAGVPVSYGQFIDTHPSICWRYYHVAQFSSALKTCPGAFGKTPPTTSSSSNNTKGSGRASVLDRIPHVSKGYGIGQR